MTISDSHSSSLCPLFAIIFYNIDEFCIIEVASRLQANQIQQPLVLFLPAEKSQAVVQRFEIMAVHHAFTFPVHQAEGCQVVLMGRDIY